MDPVTDRDDQVTANPKARKAKCSDCIYLVQTRHHLSQEVIGYHCFCLGRQQEYPNDYNFDPREIQSEIDCGWFETYEEFDASHGRDGVASPKIRRFVTIRVTWGYDWKKADSPQTKGDSEGA